MKERILLMGPPGSGKSYQLLKVAQYLNEIGTPIYTMDLEDKLEATLSGLGGIPSNMHLYVTFDWDKKTDKDYVGGVKQTIEDITNKAKPGEWIAIDRADLMWPMVQRWFTQKKYDEELADRMMQKSMDMKKASMFIPRFDQGSWQVINEQYESQILNILYKSRCNILLTTGIRGIGEENPLDIGRLGVLPRGQKELGHQPHSVFLLGQQKTGRVLTWKITTAKDIPNRVVFDNDELMDFALQYVALYYDPNNPD